MNPDKVVREQVSELTDLPNIGPAMARDLRRLGFERPEALAGADPLAMYRRLCTISGRRQDPCVLDVFMAVVDFADGGAPRPWWHFTSRRKRRHVDI